MDKDISPMAAALIDSLTEVLSDVRGENVPGMKKDTFIKVEPKVIRENLHMSQSEFSNAFGIPLSTLRNWEQGRRNIDATATSYLKTIMSYPKEVMAAQHG